MTEFGGAFDAGNCDPGLRNPEVPTSANLGDSKSFPSPQRVYREVDGQNDPTDNRDDDQTSDQGNPT